MAAEVRSPKEDRREKEQDLQTTEEDRQTTEEDLQTTEEDRRETEEDLQTTEEDRRETEEDRRETEEDLQTTEEDRRETEEDRRETERMPSLQARERKTCHPSATQAAVTDHVPQSETSRYQNQGEAVEAPLPSQALGFLVPSRCCAAKHPAGPRADWTAEARAKQTSVTDQGPDRGRKPVPCS